MMNLRLSLISGLIFFFFVSWTGVSAKSGEVEKQNFINNTGSRFISQEKESIEQDGNKGNRNQIKPSSSENTETGSRLEMSDNEKRKVELKLKREINSYIIESYKAQGNKIIKDLSIKLGKAIPEDEERKLAYEKIQDSLKSRLEKTEEIEQSDSKKEILQEFLKHLIQLLDKKIDEIEK